MPSSRPVSEATSQPCDSTASGAREEQPPFPVFAAVGLEEFMSAHQRSLRAAAEAQAHLVERLSKINNQLWQFTGRRFERDCEITQKLAACRSPQDAMALYSQFVESAVQDYSEELGLLAGICADQSHEIPEDVQRHVEETTDIPAAIAAWPGSQKTQTGDGGKSRGVPANGV